MIDRTTATFRHRNALKLMTLQNHKTYKGEAAGYLTAILYLMPHTSGGGVTLCPHSTEACREMCLAGAGLSGLPRAMGAKRRRTETWLRAPSVFKEMLIADIEKLQKIARSEGLTPVVRLNGTSDIIWEREPTRAAHNIMAAFPDIQFYDYTKIPLHHRRPGDNYHLTFSVGRESVAQAADYLIAGRSVAVVVPEWAKGDIAATLAAALPRLLVVDGDGHDLRLLDPPGSLVLLSPKGNKISDLLIPNIDRRLIDAVDVEDRDAIRRLRHAMGA